MVEQAPNKLPQDQIEREAIEALSREFRPSLVRYFSKRCKETTEIEDLVQEVFLRLVKRSVVTDVRQVGVTYSRRRPACSPTGCGGGSTKRVFLNVCDQGMVVLK